MTVRNIGDASSISLVALNWMDTLSTTLTLISTTLVIIWTVMRIVAEFPKFKVVIRKWWS